MPVLVDDRNAAVVLLCGDDTDTFSADRQRAGIQVVQCWIAELFRDGCLAAYSTQLEQISRAHDLRELIQTLAQSVSGFHEGPGYVPKLECTISIVADDCRSAVHYNLVTSVKSGSFTSNGRRCESGDLSKEFGFVGVSNGSKLQISSSAALSSTLGSVVQEIEGQAFKLEDTLLKDVIGNRMGMAIADCLEYLQGRAMRPDEVLMSATSPATSALLVEAMNDDDGQPRLGLYLALPKAGGPMFIQTMCLRLREQLSVLRTVVLKKLKAFAGQCSSSSLVADSLLGTANHSDISGEVASRSGSLRRLVCGVQDQLHSLQRMNTQALVSDDTPRDIGSVRLSRLVGKGAFGQVYLGSYCGMDVAVKVIPWRKSESCMVQKAMELTVLTTLNHTNIVQPSTFFPDALLVQPRVRLPNGRRVMPWLANPADWEGECKAVPPNSMLTCRVLVIVMEYCDKGTLQDAISQGCFQLKEEMVTDSRGVSRPAPNMRNILLVLMEAAWALAYLHRMQLVHRDIKPSNILLKASLIDPRGYTTKLSDFGLVKLVAQQSETDVTDNGQGLTSCESLAVAAQDGKPSMQFSGTVTHCAPEVMLAGPNNIPMSGAMDMYSFGILMWELYTSSPAYPRMTSDQIFQHVALDHMRMEFPEHCPLGYSSLAQRCWAVDPAARPTAQEVVSVLDTIIRSGLTGHSHNPGQPRAQRKPSRLCRTPSLADLQSTLVPHMKQRIARLPSASQIPDVMPATAANAAAPLEGTQRGNGCERSFVHPKGVSSAPIQIPGSNTFKGVTLPMRPLSPSPKVALPSRMPSSSKLPQLPEVPAPVVEQVVVDGESALGPPRTPDQVEGLVGVLQGSDEDLVITDHRPCVRVGDAKQSCNGNTQASCEPDAIEQQV